MIQSPTHTLKSWQARVRRASTPARQAMRQSIVAQPRLVAATALVLLTACGGGEDPTGTTPTPQTPTQQAPSLSTDYSARSISPNAIATPIGQPPADTANVELTRVMAYQALTMNYWAVGPVAPRVRTLWYVPATTRINGESVAPNLYLSDSLPGTGAGGTNPNLWTFATPSAMTDVYDDPALNWKWSATGNPPAVGTVTGQFFPLLPQRAFVQPCLGQDNAPYVTQRVNFVMNATTAFGTIEFDFRVFKTSCSRPRVVTHRWTMSVPFTAVRVR